MRTTFSNAFLQHIDDIVLLVDEHGICVKSHLPSVMQALLIQEPTEGLHYRSILPDPISSGLDSLLNEKDGNGKKSFECSFETEDIEWWLSIRITNVDDEDGPLHIITISNTTSSKLALSVLETSSRVLRTSTLSVVHDMRNYLFKVRAYMTLVREDGSLQDSAAVLRIVDEMNMLIEHLATLTDLPALDNHVDQVDLNTLVSDITRSLITNGTMFIKDYLPTLEGERVSIFQIFKNLIDNAMMHGKPKKVEVRLRLTDTSYIILVRNDGTPITESIRAELFRRKGSGLNVTKLLTQEQGWDLRLLDDELTTFAITIPR